MNTPSEPVLTPMEEVERELNNPMSSHTDDQGYRFVSASFAIQMAGELERAQAEIERWKDGDEDSEYCKELKARIKELESTLGTSSNPSILKIRELQRQLLEAQAEAKHHKMMADALELAEHPIKAELASAHAVLDDRECQIVRNTKDGYPEGREDRVLMLEERVRALLRMKADYKNWLEQSESGAAGLREYVAYLHEALDKVSGYLHAHNWNWSPEFLVRGDKLRDQLKSTPAGKSMVARDLLILCLDALNGLLNYRDDGEGLEFMKASAKADAAILQANQELERSGL